MTSGPIGQKSWAKRCVKGRPMMAEPTSTSETTTVVKSGWAKYKKALPVMKETTVRTVSRTVPRASSMETCSPRSSRRPRAR